MANTMDERLLVTIVDIGNSSDDVFEFSPDRKYVVLQTQQADLDQDLYVHHWYLLNTKTGQSLLIESAETVRLSPPVNGRYIGTTALSQVSWAPDSERFVYTVEKNDETELKLFNVAREKGIEIYETPSAVKNISWGSASTALQFEVDHSVQEHLRYLRRQGSAGYVFDAQYSVGYSTAPIVAQAPDSEDSKEVPGTSYYQFDLVDKSIEEISKQEFDHATVQSRTRLPSLSASSGKVVRNMRSSRMGRYAWFETTQRQENAGSEPEQILTYVDVLDDLSPKVCQAAACIGQRLQDLWWSDNEGEIILIARDGHSHGTQSLYGFNTTTGDVRTIFKTRDVLSKCDLAYPKLICLRDGWTQPQYVVSIDLTSAETETLFDPNPHLQNIPFTRVRELELSDKFGNDAIGHLVYPADYDSSVRYPLVIVQYRSRGFLRGGVGDEYPVHALAAEGFFVLSFERPDDMSIRRRFNYANPDDMLAGEILEWDGFYEKERALSTLVSVVDQLVLEGVVDADRVAITGLSDGAETVQYALLNSNKFAVAIASDLIWNPFIYYLVDEVFRNHLEAVIGVPNAGDKKWEKISLGMSAEAIRAPLLVNVADSELLYSVFNLVSLRDAGAPLDAYVFPNEYHIKSRPMHRYNIYRRNIQWLKFWLQDEEADDPIDPEQYVRWRKLREMRDAKLSQ